MYIWTWILNDNNFSYSEIYFLFSNSRLKIVLNRNINTLENITRKYSTARWDWWKGGSIRCDLILYSKMSLFRVIESKRPRRTFLQVSINNKSKINRKGWASFNFLAIWRRSAHYGVIKYLILYCKQWRGTLYIRRIIMW